jgi:hypothetical protein
MLFVELLAKKVAGPLAGVMLTIQRANTRALQFYTQKCRYTMDEISPSKTDPFAPADEYGGLSMHSLTRHSLFSLPTPSTVGYDIYSKLWSDEAKAILQRKGQEALTHNALQRGWQQQV